MGKKITISTDTIDKFRGILILNELIRNNRVFPLIGTSDDKIIDPLLISLVSKGLLEVTKTNYIATQKGKDNLTLFYRRYFEVVKMFQVYSAVDTEHGVFAYEKYWDMSGDEFDVYLNQDHWEDCRIAVAEFKKIDPVEMVFMSFLSENRIDLASTEWRFNLMSNMIWDEIIEICSLALHLEDLQEGDAIIVLTEEGAKLTVNLLEQEAKLKAQDDAANLEQQQQEEVVTTTTEIETIEEEYYDPYYYTPYYDPYYVSPIWLLLLL
jgi:hypothetical protein